MMTMPDVRDRELTIRKPNVVTQTAPYLQSCRVNRRILPRFRMLPCAGAQRSGCAGTILSPAEYTAISSPYGNAAFTFCKHNHLPADFVRPAGRMRTRQAVVERRWFSCKPRDHLAAAHTLSHLCEFFPLLRPRPRLMQKVLTQPLPSFWSFYMNFTAARPCRDTRARECWYILCVHPAARLQINRRGPLRCPVRRGLCPLAGCPDK